MNDWIKYAKNMPRLQYNRMTKPWSILFLTYGLRNDLDTYNKYV